MDEVNRSMKLIKPQGTSYALELKGIQDQERPPMLTIQEYRARRHAVRFSQRATPSEVAMDS